MNVNNATNRCGTEGRRGITKPIKRINSGTTSLDLLTDMNVKFKMSIRNTGPVGSNTVFKNPTRSGTLEAQSHLPRRVNGTSLRNHFTNRKAEAMSRPGRYCNRRRPTTRLAKRRNGILLTTKNQLSLAHPRYLPRLPRLPDSRSNRRPRH